MFYHQKNTCYETHTRMVVGTNCIEQLPEEIKACGGEKILIVSDPNVSKTEFYANCIDYVKKSGCPYLVWNEAEEEAPLRNVDTVCGILLKNACNLMIAVGGGSVIDICKLAGVLATNGGKGPDWAGYEKYSIPPMTLFTIPTTAGTSAEVTNMAVVHDEEKNVKFTVGHRILGAAKVTFLDGNSIESCPRGQIACCGIDALSHSFESYIALNANPITEALSLSGVRLISRNLRAVYGNIDGQEIRKMFPQVNRFTVDGAEVLIKHIGGYPGKYDPSVIGSLMARPPKLFISGHSHILKVKYDKTLDMLHINPGAAGMSGFHKVRTMVRFVIDNGTFKDLEVIELAG